MITLKRVGASLLFLIAVAAVLWTLSALFAFQLIYSSDYAGGKPARQTEAALVAD